MTMQQSIPREGTSTGVLIPSSLTESFEIVLARVADLRAAGADVKAIVCDGVVKGCVANPLRLAATCTHCKNVRDAAFAHVAPGLHVIPLAAVGPRAGIEQLSPDDQKELEVSVDSTILTFYRQEVATTAGWTRRLLFRALAKRYLAHSAYIHAATDEVLARRDVQRIEFFNGRIVPTRGAMMAARRRGLDFGVLEVSGRDRHLTVAHNSSVHDIHFKQQELLQFLAQQHLDRSAGVAFFESRRKGMETNDKSFTARQQAGLLRRDERPVIGIFTSSADELKVSGPQWFTDASRDPTTFIREFTRLAADRFKIVVRMHPNQEGDKTGATQAMQQALSLVPGIELISPLSKVSTYELLDAAAAVITFGSTVGLEATYWDKPSILAGRALWDQSGVAYQVATPAEALGLLATPLPAMPKDNAIAVGAYYYCGFGNPGSLSWRHQGSVGFSVMGRSYLREKRSSAAYWLNRVADRVLRKI